MSDQCHGFLLDPSGVAVSAQRVEYDDGEMLKPADRFVLPVIDYGAGTGEEDGRRRGRGWT